MSSSDPRTDDQEPGVTGPTLPVCDAETRRECAMKTGMKALRTTTSDALSSS
jgi:hypothetical protein